MPGATTHAPTWRICPSMTPRQWSGGCCGAQMRKLPACEPSARPRPTWPAVTTEAFRTSCGRNEVEGENGPDQAGDAGGAAPQCAQWAPGLEGGHGLFDERADLGTG